MNENEFAIQFENGAWRIYRRVKCFFGLFERWKPIGRSFSYDICYSFQSKNDCLIHIKEILRNEEREKASQENVYLPTYEEIMSAGRKRPEPPRGPPK